MTNSLSIKKVLQVICEGRKKIQIKGKHAIIFIAVSQTGKTTTINVLCKGSGIINENGEFRMTNNDSTNLGATGGAAGVSCTILPEAYTIGNLCFLDIQGYNDTRSSVKIYGVDLNREEIQVVASILTEMAIKLTSGISAILLLKYGDFSFKGMQESGEMINRLFNNIKLPIFILFNRFSHKSKNVMKAYYQTDGKEEIDFVKKQVINQANAMEKEKSNASFTEYFDLIKMNIDNDNYSYIDIENQEIINEVKSKIENLPIINKDQIKFDNSSSLRVKFNDLCKDMLKQWLKYLKQSYLMKVYSFNFFNGALGEMTSTISQLKGKMRNLSENKEFNSQNEINLYFENIIQNKRKDKSRKEGEKNTAERQKNEYDTKYDDYSESAHNFSIKHIDLSMKLYKKQNMYFFMMKEDIFESINSSKELFEEITTTDIRHLITETESEINVYKNFLSKYDNSNGEYLKDEKTFKNDSYFVNNTYTYTYKNSFSRFVENYGSDVHVVWRTVKKNFYQAKFEARAFLHPEMYVNIKFYENNRSRYANEINDYKEKLNASEKSLELLKLQLEKHLEYDAKMKIINDYKAEISRLKKEIDDAEKEKVKMESLEKQYEKLYTEANNKFNTLKNDIENIEKTISQKEKDKRNATLLFSAIKYFETAKKSLEDKKKKIEELGNDNKKVDDQKISEEIQSCIDICKVLEVNKDILSNIESYQKMINEFKPSSQFQHKINSETVNEFSYKKSISFNQNSSSYSLSTFESKIITDLNNLN